MKRLLALAAVGAMIFGASDALAQCGEKQMTKEECVQKCSSKKAEAPAFTSVEAVTVDELTTLISSGAVTVVDARDSEKYAGGHIDGAINLASGATLPEDKNAPLVFYCGSSKCQLAPRAAKEAAENGYTNVRVFTDGWAGWSSASAETAQAN